MIYWDTMTDFIMKIQRACKDKGIIPCLYAKHVNFQELYSRLLLYAWVGPRHQGYFSACHFISIQSAYLYLIILFPCNFLMFSYSTSHREGKMYKHIHGLIYERKQIWIESKESCINYFIKLLNWKLMHFNRSELMI